MEASALKYSGSAGLAARSRFLRLQSDERLVSLTRRGNIAAFETIVSRYEVRLLSFCRHMLGSREDAEDVLQDVMAASYSAMLADERPINVRPWLYRIARNRCLNHLRRNQTVGVDSMDIHFSDNGASTADKVHAREEFRMLVDDIHNLPETQRTALVLREMENLSYEQIAEAMDTTVSSVKSLLVRARVSLAEASESRLLTCAEVRLELGEVAEGLRDKLSAPVKRHIKTCQRCDGFQSEVKRTSKALTALMLPVGPLALFKKLLIAHIGHSAGSTAGAAGVAGTAGTTTSAGAAAAASATAAGASGSSGLVAAGVSTIAAKAAAGLAAAALVTAGAVEATHTAHHLPPANPAAASQAVNSGVSHAASAGSGLVAPISSAASTAARHKPRHAALKLATEATLVTTPTTTTTGTTTTGTTATTITGTTDTTTGADTTTTTVPTTTTTTTTTPDTTSTPGQTTTTTTPVTGGAAPTPTTTVPVTTTTTPTGTITTGTGPTTTPSPADSTTVSSGAGTASTPAG